MSKQVEGYRKPLDSNDTNSDGELDLQQMIAELQIYKIELEMQNIQLRQSQLNVEAGLERYIVLYDFAPMAYFTLDHTGAIRQLNLAGAELLGVPRALLVNKRLDIYVSPETRTSFKTFLAMMFCNHARNVCEVDFLNNAKEKLCVRVEAMLSVNENECLLALANITESKQVNNKVLRESESRLSVAQRVAHIGSWELDILTHDLWWSDETFNVFGFQKGNFGCTMEAFFDCVHPDDRTMMNAVTQAAWYYKQPFNIEHRIILPCGEERIVHEIAETVFDNTGQPIRMIGTIQDITERKRVEIALQENEKRLSDILFSTDDWIWEVDKNGVYTYSSQKGLDLLGWSVAEIIGKTPFDFMTVDEIKRIAPLFSELLANKAPIKDLENWIIKKNGERACLLTDGVPILDAEGNLTGYRGVDKDITERKNMEQEKRQFYRDTIKIITHGKLDLVSFEDVTEYLLPDGYISLVESPADSAITRKQVMDFFAVNAFTSVNENAITHSDRLDLFESAIGEALTNAIKHANGCDVYAGGGIDSIWVAISDTGTGIPTMLLPSATLLRGFSSKVSMGLGYTIMMNVTDNIKLHTGLNGTTIVLSINEELSEPVLSLDDFPDTWDEIPSA